jgi:FkbM family methyltransferase
MAGILKQTLNPSAYRLLLKLYKEFVSGFTQKSYSQEGEDMILRRIFEHQLHGFYVDVGAHHPVRFSNTFFFYKRGWKGINIDCNPGSMNLFNLRRRKDINLEYAISDKFEVLKFHTYDEPAVNTFLPENDEVKDSKYMLLKTVNIESVTLEYVLSRFAIKQTPIDFLTIDVEGMDLKVLKSNNWNRFRPKVVLVEDISNHGEFESGSTVLQFMQSIEYVLYAKTVNTLIFRERFFEP